MPRNRSLKADLVVLQARAFRHVERCAESLRRFHALRGKIGKGADRKLIWQVYDWLKAPLSLWPIDINGLARHVLSEIESDRALDESIRMLLWFIGAPPSERAQAAVGNFEHEVESGRYERLVRQPQKFDEHEADLGHDDDLSAAWSRIKRVFDHRRLQNSRGVVRRRMSEERNFRRGWTFDWRTRKSRFQLLFDAMCYRWCLYGMEGDRPLLLKVSVNPTPHGTLIMIPRHWSFDGRRDLDWRAIGALHRSHGAGRQGPKLSMARVAMYQEAVEARRWSDEGRRKGLRGERLTTFVLERMGKAPGTDGSWLKRRFRLLR